MAKPINNELLVQHPLLAFLLIEIASGNTYSDLDFEICWDRVYIFSTLDKGHPKEESSLEAMETIAPLVTEWGFVSEPLFRNSQNGDRVDGLRIHL